MIDSGKHNRIFLLAALALCVLVVILYYPSTKGGFVWDEYNIFKKGNSESFIEFYEYKFVRPMHNSIFGFEHKLWADDARPYHLLNIILHLLNIVAVYILALRLRLGMRVAAVAAAIFAFHPIATEAVSWVGGRPELLMTLFFNTSLIAYIAYRTDGDWQALASSGVFFLLALLSGQSAIVLFAIVPLCEICLDSASNRKRIVWGGISYMVAVTVYIVLLPGAGELHPIFSFEAAKIFDSLSVIGYYIIKMVLPYKQTLLPETGGAVYLLMSSLVLPAVSGLLLWEGHRRAGVLGIISFLCLVPASAVATQGYDFPVGLRHVYLAFPPLLLMISMALDTVKNRQVFNVSVAVILIALSAFTYSRTAVWQSSVSVWADSAAKADRRAAAEINHAAALERAGRDGESRAAIFRAFAKPEFKSDEFQKAALIYADAGGVDALDEFIDMASKYRSQDMALYGAGYICYREYQKTRNSPELLNRSIDYFEQALSLSPQMLDANYHLAVIYLESGEMDKARHYFGVVNSVVSDGEGADVIKSIIDRIDKANQTGSGSSGTKALGSASP